MAYTEVLKTQIAKTAQLELPEAIGGGKFKLDPASGYDLIAIEGLLWLGTGETMLQTAFSGTQKQSYSEYVLKE